MHVMPSRASHTRCCRSLGSAVAARIVSNAILINYDYCPLSFRTVDSIDYKKAMLLFYEQNNISNFKNIFIDQFEFAVRTYF